MFQEKSCLLDQICRGMACLFEFDERRVLTMKGKNKATWKYNSAYDVATRKNCAKDGVGIYYSGIWQELVLDNAESWAESLF